MRIALFNLYQVVVSLALADYEELTVNALLKRHRLLAFACFNIIQVYTAVRDEPPRFATRFGYTHFGQQICQRNPVAGQVVFANCG